MDEKELAQRDAHIRSFAIAQVLQILGHTSYADITTSQWDSSQFSLVKPVQEQVGLAVT